MKKQKYHQFTFDLYKHNNPFELKVIAKKTIKIRRSCAFIAQYYLKRKYVHTIEYDFIERDS